MENTTAALEALGELVGDHPADTVKEALLRRIAVALEATFVLAHGEAVATERARREAREYQAQILTSQCALEQLQRDMHAKQAEFLEQSRAHHEDQQTYQRKLLGESEPRKAEVVPLRSVRNNEDAAGE